MSRKIPISLLLVLGVVLLGSSAAFASKSTPLLKVSPNNYTLYSGGCAPAYEPPLKIELINKSGSPATQTSVSVAVPSFVKFYNFMEKQPIEYVTNTPLYIGSLRAGKTKNLSLTYNSGSGNGQLVVKAKGRIKGRKFSISKHLTLTYTPPPAAASLNRC